MPIKATDLKRGQALMWDGQLHITLDTDHVPPMTSAVPLDNVLRQDVAQECLPPEKLLSNAPDAARNMFRVNAVLD